MRHKPSCANTFLLAVAGIILIGLIAACQGPATPQSPKETLEVQPSITALVSVEVSTQPPSDTATHVPQPTAPLILEQAGVEYTIPLHVQHKTQDQLVLMFELDQAVDGHLYWWRAGASPQSASSMPFVGSSTPHLITLEGLNPGLTYQLAVGLEGDDGSDRMPGFMGEVWEPIEIATLPESLFPLTIAVFGDSGFGESLTADLASSIAERAPDIIVHTGDLVYSAYQQDSPAAAYRLKWYQTLSSLLHASVIYPVVGNHELDLDAGYLGMPYYFYAFPMVGGLSGGWQEAPLGAERQFYALELGPIQLLFLNTQQLYGGPARDAQNAWIKVRLADPRFASSVVIFHVPPFTSGRHSLDGVPVVSAWLPEFEAANVRLVLSGHDHNYERLKHNEITYIVSGGGSSVLYPLQQKHDESLRFDARTHYVLLEVAAEFIRLEAYDSFGQIFDSETITLIP
jgi:hypothetical protein